MRAESEESYSSVSIDLNEKLDVGVMEDKVFIDSVSMSFSLQNKINEKGR